MPHQLIDEKTREQMLRNGRKSACGIDHDPQPLVKLFTPDAGATWLLTELDPDNPDIAFGLCDLGLGEPELGSVSLAEISAVRGKLGLPVERDASFVPSNTLSFYAIAARRARAIRA